MKNQIVKLAYKLCSIPSVTGHEGEVLAYVCSWLSEHGFSYEKIHVDHERYNILAYQKPQPVFSTIFCTHLDTVAPFIKPSLDDSAGILSGRGSCDAKGIAATMMLAVKAACEDGHDDVAMLFTVGEEEASDGAKACIPKLKARARYLVVGEPTELRAAFAQKGSLVFDLKAEGKEAHSSQPELGDSAIHKLVHTMEQLLSTSWPHDTQFGQTQLNFGWIEGGLMRNVLAPFAQAKAIMRTSARNAVLITDIQKKLHEGVTMNVLSSEDPFSFHVPEGFPQFLAAFGSDAPYLRHVGEPMLIGPGSLRFAHRHDEHIRYTDLEAGATAYRRIADAVRVTFLGRN